MTCEIHDYRGSAHAHVMRMIGFGSYISNSTIKTLCFCFWLKFFAQSILFASKIETNSSTIYVILHYNYCIKKNIPKIKIADIKLKM